MHVEEAPIIAYLAPELPGLSATFVYEEMIAVESMGFRVIPLSVRPPSPPAVGQEALARRTEVLYRTSAWRLVLGGAAASVLFGRRSLAALNWLLHDMLTVGVAQKTSWKLAYQWLVAARVGRILRRQRCTHLHVHFAHVPTQIAMYASAFTGIPFTVTAHANDIFERGVLLVEKAKRARRVLAISRHNLEYLRSLGVPEEKLAVVRCGVSVGTHSDAPRSERRGRYRVGSLGRLVEKKGMDDLLRAIALLSSESWGIELTIAGDGPQRGALESLARRLGVLEHVKFEGAMPHEAVGDWLRSLDAFVLACKQDARGDMDGIPVALMEAMAHRIPVVSTRISGIPELVVDGRTGLLTPQADPQAIAAALRRLLNEPLLRTQLADAAVQHVETEFGRGVNIQRLMEYLPSPRRAAACLPRTEP